MKLRERVRRERWCKRHHNEAVNWIVEEPEVLKIEGLSQETLVFEPIQFPELRKKGQETGDFILIWRSSFKEWEILVGEVTTSYHRLYQDEFSKLGMTSRYLKLHWREWFRRIGLNLPAGYRLWLRTLAISYAGKFLFERPVCRELRIRIH